MLNNCVAYKDGDKLADLPVEQISSHLEIGYFFFRFKRSGWL
jgi:hypothetical protein